MAESTPSLRDVLTVAGGLSVIIGAFMLGRSTHPEEGCCDKLLAQNIDVLLARTGGVPSGPVAHAMMPVRGPTGDPWPTHPWDAGSSRPGVRYNET